MKFGVRECCDVVFRAKAPMKVGKRIFYKNEPVIYFDTLKTSTLEGAATTVYAQGGRGNARLMSWDGERTVTFTMEDALISPEGLSILTGAGIIDGSEETIYVHTTERVPAEEVTYTPATGEGDEATPATITFKVDETISANGGTYVLIYNTNNNLCCEPFSSESAKNKVTVEGNKITITLDESVARNEKEEEIDWANIKNTGFTLLADFYVEKSEGAMQINITPDKFGGAFYVEASTLFRDQQTQIDMPAEFIIPNARVQSNFTFTMAGSGDPSTFTFTMDAFPDYTRFDRKEKVLASIQIIGCSAQSEYTRELTNTARVEDENGLIVPDPTQTN